MSIGDYEALAAGLKPPRGERDAIAAYVSHDEPLVQRHWAASIWGEGGADLTRPGYGVAVFSTDRKAIVAGNAGGTFKPKFRILIADYEKCQSGVPAVVREMYGRPAYLSQLRFVTGDSWTISFHDRVGMEQFSEDLGGAITGYRLMHGLDQR